MQKINLTQSNVYDILRRLGIKYQDPPNNKGWLSILCYRHDDKNFGNCSVNIESAVAHCFACRQSYSLFSELRIKLNIGTYELCDLLKVPYNLEKVERRRDSKPTEIERVFNKFRLPPNKPLSPKYYDYTKTRGYTKDYVQRFGLCYAEEGYYGNYFFTPIIDDKYGIETFEARKLNELEQLRHFFKTKESLKVLRKRFKELAKKQKYKIKYYPEIKDFKLIEAEEEKEGYWFRDIIYFLRRKVLYPKDSNHRLSIFNRPNLDYSRDLYVTEGLASLPKIYQYVSKNCSSTYGVELEENQIDLLNEFKARKIFILDDDDASYEMVVGLYHRVDDMWVLVPKVEDTDENYVRELSIREPIEASRYLVRKSGILDF